MRARIIGAALVVIAIATGLVAYRMWKPAIHPERYGMRIVEYHLASSLLGDSLEQRVVTPPDPQGRPLLVLLHGRGSSPERLVRDEMLAALARQGEYAPVVVLPYGGDASYWHDRESGEWGTYVVREVIPEAVRRFEVDAHRIAIGGMSMGGFGALDLARLHPNVFCVVGAHSPALFEDAGSTPDGAFDDADDFARHDLFDAIRDPSVYEGKKIWIDSGDDDLFAPIDRDLTDRLRDIQVEVRDGEFSGGHDDAYWQGHMDDYMEFYAGALRNC